MCRLKAQRRVDDEGHATSFAQLGAHDDEGQPEIYRAELGRGAGARGNGGPRESSPRSVGLAPLLCVAQQPLFGSLLEQNTSSPHLPETRAVLGPRHSSLGLHIPPTA